MTVQRILDKKTQKIISLERGSTIKQAVEAMVRHNIGALVIVDEKQEPVGIMTERDILRELHGNKAEEDIYDCPVDRLMSTELIIGLPTDTLEYVDCVFTNNRIRHLPIFDKGKMIGMVSIGDIVKARLKETESENRYLRDFIMDKYPG